ncbi:hypothetical protein ACIGBL_05050 [Streptomyces sp. NPDC085614]|uniref:hypothetical protein n=1 Tax=Streptomyces sp. NPDC085614 TaxID=3365733 RepID=UPI0037D836AC
MTLPPPDEPARDPRAEPGRGPAREGPGDDSASPTMLLKLVIAQGTFIAGLLFYLGAMYTSSYYGYFRISLGTLDLGFGELATQSLHLLKLEVLVAAGLIVLAVIAPSLRVRRHPTGAPRAGGRAEALGARLSLPVVAVGVLLLALWTQIQPYGWTAPFVIGAGLLLTQCRDARGRRPHGFRRRALPVFAAAVFLFWGLTRITVDTAQRDARSHARHVADWTGVVVLSSRPLSLPDAEVHKEVLPTGLLHRYRYTGLRLLLERDGRYYVVPLGWTAEAGAIYVVRESESTWVGLTP